MCVQTNETPLERGNRKSQRWSLITCVSICVNMCTHEADYTYVIDTGEKKESNRKPSIIIGHIFTWIMKSSFFFAISINQTTSINLLFVFFFFAFEFVFFLCIWKQNTNCILAHGLFLSYYDFWIYSCTFSVIKYLKRRQSIERRKKQHPKCKKCKSFKNKELRHKTEWTETRERQEEGETIHNWPNKRNNSKLPM